MLVGSFEVGDVQLPLSKGSMGEIGDEELESQESIGSQEGMGSSQFQRDIYDREARIRVNYQSLDVELKEVWSAFVASL